MTKDEARAWINEVDTMQEEFRETSNMQHDTIVEQDGNIDELLVIIGGGAINEEQVLRED